MNAVIGITGSRSVHGCPDYPPNLSHLRADVFEVDYSIAVAAVGGVPVLLTRESDPASVVARVDGLLIAGGVDVDPRRYGSVPGTRSTMLDPGRDEFESALIRLAVQAGRPVLGVCRGHQILNVSLGGTLIADLPDEAGEGHGFLGYPPDHRSHAVVTHPGTTAAHLYGDRLMVNSYHHQAVDTIAPGLRAIAYAPDGVVEAIELPGADVVGVQWHPEMLAHADPIFGWLVGSATARSSVGEERSHAHA